MRKQKKRERRKKSRSNRPGKSKIMSEELERKFKEVEHLVEGVENNEIDLAEFFERLSELCDDIDALTIDTP